MRIGDKVRKVSGYPFAGTLVTLYDDDKKCAVKHADGWEHIFRVDQVVPDLPEFQYLDLLRDCLNNGVAREYRNGVRRSLFGRQIRFDLERGFPLLTTKRVFWRGVAAELLWFIDGDTNARTLQDQGVRIWDEWAAEDGALGPVYGAQWRDFGGVDQLLNVIRSIRADPTGTRHIVSAWNPVDLPDMALPPCHMMYQFYVTANGRLCCNMYMRSADIFLGVPFNIASYALLLQLVARECNLTAGELVISFGDVHLYDNHVDAATEQLQRQPTTPPRIFVTGDDDIFNITIDDIVLHGYTPAKTIKAEVSR